MILKIRISEPRLDITTYARGTSKTTTRWSNIYAIYKATKDIRGGRPRPAVGGVDPLQFFLLLTEAGAQPP